MMKKCILVLLTFVPIIVGYVINHFILVPIIGRMLFYVLPLLTTAFWFYLGRQYACTTWKAIPAILIGNATGVVSLGIYLWQYLVETKETMNLTLASVSQMFSGSVPSFVLVPLLRLVIPIVERQPNYAGIASMVALHVMSLVYMVIVFCVGMFFEKKYQKGKNELIKTNRKE